MWRPWILAAIGLNILHLSVEYKILVVFPFPGKSHSILGDGYVRNLLNAGHEVTYVTTIPYKTKHERLRQVDISSNFDFFPKNNMNIKAVMDKELDLTDHSDIIKAIQRLTNGTVLHENVQKLLNDNSQHFDVVISEWLLSELYSGFAAVFNCPFIWSNSLDPHWMMLRLIDEQTNPAYVGSFDSVAQPPFTFVQRVKALGMQIIVSLMRWSYASYENDIYEAAFGPPALNRGVTLPKYEDLKFNVSLILGNSHPPLSSPVRLPQNYKEVGGYHIEAKDNPLPEDLKNIMDNANNGVIYFSMGSNLKSQDIPEDLKKDLLEMFGQLQQTVIWKFEEEMPNLPKNIHILKWAPQASILAHSNCMLFITHGGLLSISETVQYGVPIIGIPVFADQFTNIARAVEKGFGKKIDLSYDLVKDLKDAIQDIIRDTRYRERAKEISTLFHDRPLSPGAELVYWVEHVVRTGGAPHLRSPALMVPWYQKMYLDVLSIIFPILIIIFVAIKYLCLKKKNKIRKRKVE